MASEGSTSIGAGAGTGAVSGATTGAAGGPWGALIGGILGAGLGAYGASEANKNASTVDPEYQRFVNMLAQNDAQVSQWQKNFYQTGVIDPYEDQNLPVETPYKVGSTGKFGYYYDKKRGIYMNEQQYKHRSGGGNKDLENADAWHYRDESGERAPRFEFIEVNKAETEGGYAALEAKKLAAQQTMFDQNEAGLLEWATKQTELMNAQADEDLATTPLQGQAARATYQNTIDVTPYKTATEIAALQEQQSIIDQRAPVISEYFSQVMKGVDPKESMDSATAEVMKANDATKAGMQRDAMAMGVAPGSERYNAMMKEDRNQTVGAIADARTAARNQAEDTNFDRLSAAMNAGGA